MDLERDMLREARITEKFNYEEASAKYDLENTIPEIPDEVFDDVDNDVTLTEDELKLPEDE